jgi:drug/metabolite transporter (DMT)-like permease
MSEKKGVLLVFLTAAVSGISIFANSFAVESFNPAAFTFLKTAIVAVFLFSLLFLLKDFSSLKKLSGKQLAQLAAIGLLGGSIPFLLFFHALQFTTAVNAGFLHKTLFVWATLFAFLFLKEKVDKRFMVAGMLLLAGNFALFTISSFGLPEMLILLATLLWASENTLSKHVLRELSGSIVAFGRMFFGSLFILAFLALTNQTGYVLALSADQIYWVLITAGFLLAYVFTFYSGLRYLPVYKATAVLLLAQPITALLSLAFLGKAVSLQQAFGFLLILSGIFLAVGLGFFLNASKSKVPSIAAERN